VERSIEGDRVLLKTTEPVLASHQLTGWALEQSVELERFSVSQPSLEDIYLELTGATNHSHQADEAIR
jgi:hypothetical protein